jgi:hypothetical protein
MEMQYYICAEIVKIATMNFVQCVETFLHINEYLISRIPFKKNPYGIVLGRNVITVPYLQMSLVSGLIKLNIYVNNI